MTETMAAPADLADWLICGRCRNLVYGRSFTRALKVCPECGHHAPLTAHERAEQLFDPDSTVELPVPPDARDVLEFVDTKPYPQRLSEARRRTGLTEAVLTLRGTIGGHPVVAAVMDFRFMGGSLGSGTGELVTRAAEESLRTRTPLLMVTSSGGARMQEGIISLMQMGKTAQALAALDEAGILTVTLVTDPTFAGVAASFATLADVIIAEPRSRMGFAGPRVIAQTIRQSLPEGFQTAEFLLEHGQIDDVVPRAGLRAALANLLAVTRQPDGPLPAPAHDPRLTRVAEAPAGERWQTVRIARDIARPTTLDYVHHLVEGFQELHGDRLGGDCPAIVGGVGRLGRPVVVIGHQKGHDTRELVKRNFGMPNPEGYRKAARLMRLAAKLSLPVVALIDTQGAYPGIEAEERGQAAAIAENLRLMSGLPVPIVAVVTGEGGSGGALALGMADRIYMLSNAVYSVISPEGCAAILWNDAAAAPRAAEALRVCAPDLLRLGIVDAVVPEPDGGAQAAPSLTCERVGAAITATLAELAGYDADKLVEERRRRFRQYGIAAEDGWAA